MMTMITIMKIIVLTMITMMIIVLLQLVIMSMMAKIIALKLSEGSVSIIRCNLPMKKGRNPMYVKPSHYPSPGTSQ